MADAVDVGLLPMAATTQDDDLEAFTRRLGELAQPALLEATGRPWRMHVLPTSRTSAGPRSASAFLDEAAIRMVEGPYDIIVVVTDVPVTGRRTHAAGLASSVARIAVLSAWKLRLGTRHEEPRQLDAPAVERNGAALLLHLLGHALGAPRDKGAMEPWAYDPDRDEVPGFESVSADRIRRAVRRMPEPVAAAAWWPQLVGFHLVSALRNPRLVWRPIVRSRAPFLPLAMPRLSTAALLPLLVLVFTAEIWDVGVNMSDTAAVGLAATAVTAAASYIVFATDLLFPRKERRLMTEHLAVVNVAIVATVTVAMLGLLAMLCLIVLGIVFLVFPEGLIRTWPTLGGPDVDLHDRFRLALFVGSIGTLTGALGAGLENRVVLRRLAIFREEV